MADPQSPVGTSDEDWLKSAGLSTPAPVPAADAKPSLLHRAWDALTTTPDFIQKPADALADKINAGATGKNPWLDSLRGFAAGALQGGTRAFANPVGIASAAAGLPEEAVAAPLLRTAIRGANAVAGTAGVVEGSKEAFDPTLSTLDRFAGGGKAALGALQAVLGLKDLTTSPTAAPTSSRLPVVNGRREYSVPSATPVPPRTRPSVPSLPAQWPDLSPNAPLGPLTRAEQVQGIEPLRLLQGGDNPNPPLGGGSRYPTVPTEPRVGTPDVAAPDAEGLDELAPPPTVRRNPPSATSSRTERLPPSPIDAFQAAISGRTPEPLELPTRDTTGQEHFDTTPPGTTQPALPLSGAADQGDLQPTDALNRALGFDLAATPKSEARGPGYRERVLADSGTGAPGLSVEEHPDPMNSDQTRTHVVYRDPNGTPIGSAILGTTEDGKRAVTNLASDPTKGLLTGRAMKAIGAKLQEMDAARPYAAVSPDVDRLLQRMASRGPRAAAAPPELPASTPPVHPAIQALHDALGPKWDAALKAQEGDNIPFTVDPRESLHEFNDRILNGNPRELMGGERKARAAALAGDETGAIDPKVALHLGGAALGGVVGAADQPDHPVLGGALGASMGAAAPLLVTHPEVGQALRYLNLLSSPVTVGKKILGDVAGAGNAMLDRAAARDFSGAGRVGKEFFSPQTAKDVISNIRRGPNSTPTVGAYGPEQPGILGLTHRVYGGITDAAKAAYLRAGLTPEEAAHYTYTGAPKTKLGNAFLSFAARSGPIGEMALPFTRVATNIAEQGTQAIPGVGFVPLLAKVARGESVAPSEWAAAGLKQVPGAGAVLAGKSAADTEAQKGTPTAGSIVSRLGTAAAGPLQVPFEVAKAAEKTRLAAMRSKEGGTPTADAVSKALWDTLFPLSASDIAPSNVLTQAIPSVLPEAARLAGEEPRSFNTHSLLGPTIARIPGLNEVMLKKSATYKPPPTAAAKADTDWLASAGIR